MGFLQETDEVKEMYYLYGIAAHNCSNIEYRIASLLLGPRWAEIENLDAGDVAKVYEDLYRKPLSALFHLYKEHYEFPEKTKEEMKVVLDKRNYLIHRFFGAYGKRMHDDETILEMIKELKDLIGIFQAASYSLDSSG